MRPLPTPSSLSRPFWDATREHRLIRPHCPTCGKSFFVPQVACPGCLAEDWEWLESSGRGAVYSYTVCHRAPVPGFETPYAIAIVDLEEGWQMMSNLIDAEPGEIQIGQAVEVEWLDLTPEITLPVFAPTTTRERR